MKRVNYRFNFLYLRINYEYVLPSLSKEGNKTT